MATYSYKGVTTKRVYKFGTGFAAGGVANISSVPAALQDVNGNPILTSGTYNGETVVWVNNDGSQQRGVAGAQPANAFIDSHASPNVYDAYAAPSIWEQQ